MNRNAKFEGNTMGGYYSSVRHGVKVNLTLSTGCIWFNAPNRWLWCVH